MKNISEFKGVHGPYSLKSGSYPLGDSGDYDHWMGISGINKNGTQVDIALIQQDNSVCDEEQEANGKLLAASFDLLKALQEMVDAFTDRNGNVLNRSSAIDSARAAIAKALGEM